MHDAHLRPLLKRLDVGFLRLALCAITLLGICTLYPGSAWAQRVRVGINSEPPGALVYIDGKENGSAGTASPELKLQLRPGQHRVQLELEGYRSVEQVITVTKPDRFSFTLQKAPARLEVRLPGTNDSARGAEFFLDGVRQGTVPSGVEVAPGPHLVEVRKPGYRVYSEQINFRPGDTRTVWARLSGDVRAGTLLVESDVRPAEVYVDGQPRGPVPAYVESLAEGEHRVEVRRMDGVQGAAPFVQTVRIVAGQAPRVKARFGGAAGQGGSLLVLSSQEGEVYVDGQPRGKMGQEISDIKPGDHFVELRTRGGGAPLGKAVTIEVGKRHTERLERGDTAAQATGRGRTGNLRIIMSNPVDGASYYINGRKYDEAAVLSDRGVDVAAGVNIVVVRKENYGEARQTVQMKPGGTEVVLIDLSDVGSLVVTSEPRGAKVFIENQQMGQTPYMAKDLQRGSYLVTLQLAGYEDYKQRVTLRGGEQFQVAATLSKLPGPAPDENARKLAQAPYSANAMAFGNFAMDLGAGYPYFLMGRLTVGARSFTPFGGKGAAAVFGLGLDAGLELRTTFYETDIGGNLKAQFMNAGPIALALNAYFGGGGGPRGRNSFVAEFGVPITLSAGKQLKVTVRPFLQYYTDQLCPSVSDINGLRDKKDISSLFSLALSEHSGDRCSSNWDLNRNPQVYPPYARNAVADAAGIGIPMPGAGGMVIQPRAEIGTPLYDPEKPEYQEDGTPVLSRFSGTRYFIQGILEFSFRANASIWAIIEGAPFQGGLRQRQAYTDKFNRIFPLRDFPLYGRIGYTAKF